MSRAFSFNDQVLHYSMFNNFFLENIILPTGDFFLGTSFMKELNLWRNEFSNMSENELQQLQKERLNKILNYSVTNIPFYQKQNIQLTNNPFADIRKFPVMSKKMMKENNSLLLIHDKNKMVVEKSSGSSGIQGEVYMTDNENRKYQAAQTFLWEWSGYKIGLPIMQTGISSNRGLIKGIKDILFQTYYVNAYELSYEKIVRELSVAKKKRCKYFGGYASSLNVFAETAIKAGLEIPFNGVISWGDKLFEHYKRNINEAFGKPVITELYGSSEGFVISGTCAEGNMHLLSPQTYIELIDKNGNEVKPGEIGYVVATRLDAFSFPLIRYYLGDLAIKKNGNEKCNCGKHFPMLEKVIGRDTDIVHTPSGKALIVHFFTGIFEHVKEIKQFRIVQQMACEIEIEYVPDYNFTYSILDRLSETIFEKANERFNIKYSEVDTIEPTASGKPQIIQNLISEKPV